MHPKYLLKTKALLWFWLNYNPAECGISLAPEESGSEEDTFEPDMIIYDTRGRSKGEWSIGSHCSDLFFTQPNGHWWYDVNLVIERWFEGLTPLYRERVWKYLKRIKGKPLASWRYRWTPLAAPDYELLCQEFIDRGLIK